MNLTRFWSKIALFNFLILSFIGLVLRYKILFPLPFVDHKHLLHGHSHFAFSGWVSTALYVAYIHLLSPEGATKKKLWFLLWIHFISSWGMLLTFPFMGYAAASIICSTVSILVSFVLCYEFLKLIKTSNRLTFERKWFYAALTCNVLSAFGTFLLAFMMITKNTHPYSYFGAVYFYLHFQYNGWFLLTILGLLMTYASRSGITSIAASSDKFFLFIVSTLLPTWTLTLLWMNLPSFIKALAFLSALVQLIGLIFFLKVLKRMFLVFRNMIDRNVLVIWTCSISAFILKIILQTFSAIPQLNQYAFGVRPIIIGFLHLVLLGFVSLFLLGYLFEQALLDLKQKMAQYGLWIFVCGVMFNELILMIQGLVAIKGSDLPNSNYLLLSVTLMMFLGLLTMFISQIRLNSGQESIHRFAQRQG